MEKDTLNVRLDEQTVDRIKQAIQGTDKSINSFVVEAITKALDSLEE